MGEEGLHHGGTEARRGKRPVRRTSFAQGLRCRSEGMRGADRAAHSFSASGRKSATALLREKIKENSTSVPFQGNAA